MADAGAPRGMVFSGAHVRIGRFRARPEDELFRQSGPARACLVVFPRTAVRIRHAGEAGLIADPTRVVFYNARQEYERAVLSPEGDRCEWFAFRAEELADALAPYDPRAADRPGGPFAMTHGPGDPETYAMQRMIVEHAARGGAPAMRVEARAFEVLARVLAAAYRARGVRVGGPSSAARARHTELADAARATIALRFAEPLSLADLSSALGVSAFHLCRVFRRETGRTVHGYLDALRVHHALERIVDGGADLTTLALDLGYASHSHFTYAFRRTFGVPPSEARRAARDPSKILTARPRADVRRSSACRSAPPSRS